MHLLLNSTEAPAVGYGDFLDDRSEWIVLDCHRRGSFTFKLPKVGPHSKPFGVGKESYAATNTVAEHSFDKYSKSYLKMHRKGRRTSSQLRG